MAAFIPVPPTSTPMAWASSISRLRSWVTMVCELYPLCAILLGYGRRRPREHRKLSSTCSGRRRSRTRSVSDPGFKKTVSQPAALAFFDHAINLLNGLKNTQSVIIQEAAELCADRIAKGGLVFLFGNGHSRMMVEEMTPRQGGFPGFVALVEDRKSTRL